MPSLYEVAGADLDTLLAPYHAGWPQAAPTKYGVGGADLNARYAPLSTGSAPAPTKYYSGGADLSTIFAAYGSTAVQVATQPGNVSGAAAAGSPSGTVTSNTTTVAATKGGGNYTYQWNINITSGSGVAFTNPTGATTGVTGTIPAGATYSGTMDCTMSDGVTSVTTNSSSWSLQNTTPVNVQHTYTSGSGTETAPISGTVIIEVVGGGASGGLGNLVSGNLGGGGGASGYARSSYPVAAGDTLSYIVGGPGIASQVSSGTLAITTMAANPGTVGGDATGTAPGAGGPGGSATGGNQDNAVGGAGASGNAGAAGGISPAGEYIDTSSYGKGGNGSINNTSHPGTGGVISFYYIGG